MFSRGCDTVKIVKILGLKFLRYINVHNSPFLSLHYQNSPYKCNFNSGDISPDSAVLKHSMQKYRCPSGNRLCLQIVQNPSYFLWFCLRRFRQKLFTSTPSRIRYKTRIGTPSIYAIFRQEIPRLIRFLIFSRSTSIRLLCFFILIPPYQPLLNGEPLKRCSFLHLLFELNMLVFFHAKTVQRQRVETSYDLNLYKYRRLHNLKDLNGDAVSYKSVLNYEGNCSIL